MRWTLDIRNLDKTWTTIGDKPSCDACKKLAREIFRDNPIKQQLSFRIYSPSSLLYVFSADNDGWWMRWQAGDGRQRYHAEMKEI